MIIGGTDEHDTTTVFTKQLEIWHRTCSVCSFLFFVVLIERERGKLGPHNFSKCEQQQSRIWNGNLSSYVDRWWDCESPASSDLLSFYLSVVMKITEGSTRDGEGGLKHLQTPLALFAEILVKFQLGFLEAGRIDFKHIFNITVALCTWIAFTFSLRRIAVKLRNNNLFLLSSSSVCTKSCRRGDHCVTEYCVWFFWWIK